MVRTESIGSDASATGRTQIVEATSEDLPAYVGNVHDPAFADVDADSVLAFDPDRRGQARRSRLPVLHDRPVARYPTAEIGVAEGRLDRDAPAVDLAMDAVALEDAYRPPVVTRNALVSPAGARWPLLLHLSEVTRCAGLLDGRELE